MTARILVIDDTKYLLELYREILRDEGYEVLLFSQDVATDSISELHPDLIILDKLTGRQPRGRQLLCQLKREPTTASIPVILCTSAPHAARAMDEFLQANEINVLSKPFELDDLLRLIQATLERRAHSPGGVIRHGEFGSHASD